MNCDHEWSFGIYGLAYRCKKCDCLPPLDVAHHVALERIKDTFKQLASARSRIEELEGALRKIASDDFNARTSRCSDQVVARQALSGKEPVEPKEVVEEELAKEISAVPGGGAWNCIREILADRIAAHLLSKYRIKEKV